ARAGSAALLSSEGDLTWQVPSAGEELAVSVPPAYLRGLIVLPGERVRIVEPRGAEVLAEIPAGGGLCGLEVDRRVIIYLLDYDGMLKAYRLASHYALVKGQRPSRSTWLRNWE